jgi:hypothetical protein
MSRPLRECNLGHEGTLAQIKEVLAANASLYAGIHMSAVAFLQNDKWRNALCVVRGIPKTSGMPTARGKLEYPRLKFLEKELLPSDLPAFLDDLKGSRQLHFDQDTVELGQNYASVNSYELLPGENDYSQFPGYFYEATRDSVNLTQEPLIDFKSPFYPSPYHAVRDWVNIRGFSADRDSRTGSLLLFLPECRARFAGLDCLGDKLHIKVALDSSPSLDLKVVGRFQTKEGDRLLSERLANHGVEIPAPAAIDYLELYLIGADNTIYDFHRESGYNSASHRRILVKKEPSLDAAVALKAIDAGESETVEFKPFIDVGHPKINELVETVIAFANTKGGTILLGVNNHCAIEGIEKDLTRIAAKSKRPTADVKAEYIGGLRQQVAGALNRTVPLAIVEQQSEGHLTTFPPKTGPYES